MEAMSIPEVRDGWTIVVPVKPAALGKTRLTAVTADRETLARAIAIDTIVAAAATPRVSHVLVVTDDAEVSALVSTWPAVDVIAEGDVRGLDAAIALGAATAGQGAPRRVPAAHGVRHGRGGGRGQGRDGQAQ